MAVPTSVSYVMRNVTHLLFCENLLLGKTDVKARGIVMQFIRKYNESHIECHETKR